jgi:hypothetical protein
LPVPTRAYTPLPLRRRSISCLTTNARNDANTRPGTAALHLWYIGRVSLIRPKNLRERPARRGRPASLPARPRHPESPFLVPASNCEQVQASENRLHSPSTPAPPAFDPYLGAMSCTKFCMVRSVCMNLRNKKRSAFKLLGEELQAFFAGRRDGRELSDPAKVVPYRASSAPAPQAAAGGTAWTTTGSPSGVRRRATSTVPLLLFGTHH